MPPPLEVPPAEEAVPPPLEVRPAEEAVPPPLEARPAEVSPVPDPSAPAGVPDPSPARDPQPAAEPRAAEPRAAEPRLAPQPAAAPAAQAVTEAAPTSEPAAPPAPVDAPAPTFAPAPAGASAPSPPPASTPPSDPQPPAAPVAAPAYRRGPDAPSVVLDREPVEDWSALDEPRPPASRSRPRGPLAVRVLAACALVVGLAALGFLFLLFQPLHGSGKGRVSVNIPRGATAADAGRRLAALDIVASDFLFRVRSRLRGGGDVKPGAYRLPRDMSYGAALDALAAGPPKPRTTSITITEGRTRREASALLARTSLRGSYARATVRSPQLDPTEYGAPRGTPSLEGFLFPATYEIRVGAPVGDLVDRQLRAFRERFARVDLRRARRAKLTPYDVLIIASMIEREAQVAKDRRLVSAVIYNRLRIGYPLGIDATLRYALNNQTRALRQSELNMDSPYNTRLNQGLPPTPIGNPGLAAIQAAANPARSDFLYFVVKPGTCGEHAFSRDFAQFERDAERYSAAREAEGGRSPVKCR